MPSLKLTGIQPARSQDGVDVRLELQAKPEKDEAESFKKVSVSHLINSIYWFIEHTVILEEKKGYRLFVIHQGTLLVNKIYDTPKAARIAFKKFFGHKDWQKQSGKGVTMACWSAFLQREPDWEPFLYMKNLNIKVQPK